MNESIQRFGISAGAQSSSFIGILFSCLTGILLIGIPLELVVHRLISLQPMFLYEFIGWLLFFSGGALLAAVGAWCGYLVTSGSQPARFRPIVAASEIAAIVLAIAAALVLSERAIEKHTNAIFSKLGLSEERDLNRRVSAVLVYLHHR